jgi:hypothetical protein
MPFSIVAPAEVIRDLLCGPQQHNEHCKGWRWHLYTRDDAARFDAVNAELVKMREERRSARRSNIVQLAAE